MSRCAALCKFHGCMPLRMRGSWDARQAVTQVQPGMQNAKPAGMASAAALASGMVPASSPAKQYPSNTTEQPGRKLLFQ